MGEGCPNSTAALGADDAGTSSASAASKDGDNDAPARSSSTAVIVIVAIIVVLLLIVIVIGVLVLRSRRRDADAKLKDAASSMVNPTFSNFTVQGQMPVGSSGRADVCDGDAAGNPMYDALAGGTDDFGAVYDGDGDGDGGGGGGVYDAFAGGTGDGGRDSVLVNETYREVACEVEADQADQSQGEGSEAAYDIAVATNC